MTAPDTLPVTPMVRADVINTARQVLLVKGGKFAERPLDVTDLIRVAEWLLTGVDPFDVDDLVELPSYNVTVNNSADVDDLIDTMRRHPLFKGLHIIKAQDGDLL